MKYDLTFENYGTCEKYTIEGPDVFCLQDESKNYVQQ